jgi:hypothetical protein
LAEPATIWNLNPYGNKEGKSDKVWGYFHFRGKFIPDSGNPKDITELCFRFWGKRTRPEYSIKVINAEEAIELAWKKRDSGYQIIGPENRDFDEIDKKLKTQLKKGVKGFYSGLSGNFVLADIAIVDEKISRVTQEEMDSPIHPKDVTKSIEFSDNAGDLLIAFYNHAGSLLGYRPAAKAQIIYDHLRKTKSVTEEDRDAQKGQTILRWSDDRP